MTRTTSDTSETRRLIATAMAVLLVLSTGYHGWAVYSAWFYRDDYQLLVDAHGARLGLDYLLLPHDTALMPGTRLIAWLVDLAPLSWSVAATASVLLKIAAGASVAWMLWSVFGARVEIVALFAVYLTSAMTIPATMWWTASLNQMSVQVAFATAVGAWVRYLRGRRLLWLLATNLGLAYGLLFFVKTLLVVPVLGFLAMAYFASGSLPARFVAVLTRFWPAALSGGLLVAAYLAYYTGNVRQPFDQGTSAQLALDTTGNMIGTSFATGALGGPWRWAANAPPGSIADPPLAAVVAAWAVLTLLVVGLALLRTRTLRAWVLLAAYLGALVLLLVTSRGLLFGSVVGLEYRYLTDATGTWVLCLGLALLPVPGALECSEPRARLPRWLPGRPRLRAVAIGATAVVCAGGVLSSSMYVDRWHRGNISDAYLHALRSQLQTYGRVDLVDQPVPEDVVPSLFTPDNTVSALAPLLGGEARFPLWSDNLATVRADGAIRKAVLDLRVAKSGEGDTCGWLARPDDVTIDLGTQLYPWGWWVRIGYIANQESPVTVTAGDNVVEATVQPGLHSLFVRSEGSLDTVTVADLAAGTSLCITDLEVGEPVPGEPL